MDRLRRSLRRHRLGSNDVGGIPTAAGTSLRSFLTETSIPGQGDFYYDPLRLTIDPVKKKDWELKEITHGRLAMLAFSGVVTQAVLTGKGFPYF